MTEAFHHHLTDGHAFTITDAAGQDIQVGAGWAVMKEEELQRLLALQQQHATRVSELLAANNREVERRRTAERALLKMQQAAGTALNLLTTDTGPVADFLAAIHRHCAGALQASPASDGSADHSPDAGKMVPPAPDRADALAKLIREKFVGVAWDDMDYVLDDEDWHLILAGLAHLVSIRKSDAEMLAAVERAIRSKVSYDAMDYGLMGVTEAAKAVLALLKPQLDAAAELLSVVDRDVLTHRRSWQNLLHTYAKSLPPDYPATAEADGCSDKTYAEHEYRAAKRDLDLLATAAERAKAAGIGGA